MLIAVVVALVAAACGSADSSESEHTIADRAESTVATEASTQHTAETTATTRAYDTASTEAGADAKGVSESPTVVGSAQDQAASAYESIEEDAPDDVIAQDYGTNPFARTDREAESTFALDVDTGSYTISRRWIEEGQTPDVALVRVEEFVNFFDQDYASPSSGTFAVYADGAPTPFTTSSLNHIVRIGIKARDVAEATRPDAVLTFVVDVSGSMNEGNRIEIVRSALRTLVKELRPTDSVAIVAYDRNAWIVLDPTQAWNQDAILNVINRLEPGGSTNAEAGLTLGRNFRQ
jgi:Ca-activated chloride channel family protein